jgi:hypothetical protein
MNENAKQAPEKLDKFTRNYGIGLAVLVLAGLVWWLLPGDSELGALNEVLENDPQLSAYDYRFRVLALENGVATLSSPRSAQMSPMQFLRTLHPELAGRDVTDPAFMAAQDELVAMQSRAAELVRARTEVERVRWQLDERWYARHGIAVPSG